jgi:hypothetical protein
MRGNRRTGAQFHQVVDNHFVAGLQATEDDPVPAQPFTGLDRARRHLVVGIGQHHHGALLGLHHGGLRYQEHAVALAGKQADAHELAGQQLAVRVGEFGAQGLRAEGGVDVGGEEIQLAWFAVNRAIGLHQFYAADIFGGNAAVGKFGEVAFAQAEAHPHRVQLVNGGQQAVAADRDQVAFRLGGAAGGAGDRRGDRGPRQVKFGLAQSRLCDGVVRGSVVVFLLADRLRFDQAFQALRLAAGLLGLGAGFAEGDFIT